MKRNRSVWVSILVLAAALAILAPRIVAKQEPSAPKAQAEAQKSDSKKPDAAKPEEKKSDEKSFDDAVKDMEVVPGLFTIYRKAEDNKTLMEIRPDQLDTVYLFAGTLDQSIGERGLYASQAGDDFPFYFHRVGQNIQWIEKNTRFTADRKSPQARAIARSFPEAFLGSAKIQSKPHPERKSVLVDAAELFVSDLPGFAPALSEAYEPSAYRFDQKNSNIRAAKVFPENVLFDITLHYVTDNPKGHSATLPDARSVPFIVKYDLSALPEGSGFKPRMADDRVGHFATVQQDFTSDRPSIPYVRYINRWHLEKADPTAKLSPPKQPIVFWLENTIPSEYRDAMREGVLLWNKAFERIGFKDAIVVQQQPDNADWDAADIRYNTIRWFAGIDATFAVGYSRANPFTGQTYNAQIGMSEGIFRYTRREGEELVAPVVSYTDEPLMLPTAWSHNLRFQCEYANGLAQQAAFAVALLDARGELSPELQERLMHEYIVETTAHEVGHTLGLRHNFRASTLLKLSDLGNIPKTEEMGQTSSVMDYNPIVIAPKGQKQGHFLTPTLGPYDYWAIEYAYTPIAGDEKADLAKIASRVADPTLPYSTDEDALGTTSPRAMDPLANQFDHSDDPLAFFEQRLGIVRELWNSEQTKLAKPGEGYQVLRRALVRGMNEYRYGLVVSSKYIGGIYTHRDHVGDPNGRAPYTTVPAAKQREALEMLRTYAFSEKAFDLPPGLLNRAAIERQPGVDFLSYFVQTSRLDFPWHEAVLGTQSAVLNRLYHPIVLARIEDNELRFEPSEKVFTMADMFSSLDSAIWSELDRGAPKISSLRRNLQRDQLKRLMRLVLRTPQPPAPSMFGLQFPPTPPPPEDATTLARASLVNIQGKIKKLLAAGTVTDPTTRAHLDETQALIAATLQAQVQKPVE